VPTSVEVDARSASVSLLMSHRKTRPAPSDWPPAIFSPGRSDRRAVVESSVLGAVSQARFMQRRLSSYLSSPSTSTENRVLRDSAFGPRPITRRILAGLDLARLDLCTSSHFSASTSRHPIHQHHHPPHSLFLAFVQASCSACGALPAVAAFSRRRAPHGALMMICPASTPA